MTAPHRRVRGVADVDGVPDGVVAGGDERVVDELLLRDFAGGEGGGELPEPGLKLSVTAGHAGLLSDSPSAAFASAAWRAVAARLSGPAVPSSGLAVSARQSPGWASRAARKAAG